MKKYYGLLALFILATLPCAAQTLKLYDDFDGKFISPSRWAYAFCYSSDGPELECVREIRDEKLHLAHREFGLTNSNTGQQNGGAGVGFGNPETIKTIKTDMVVQGVLEVPCAVNTTFGSSAGISGNFFNAGSGDPSDDAGAQFGVTRFTWSPAGQLTVRGQTFHGSVYSDFFTIGTVPIGTPIIISLSWDQPNHQFVISFTNKVTKRDHDWNHALRVLRYNPSGGTGKGFERERVGCELYGKLDFQLCRRVVRRRLRGPLRVRAT
jgi:hypothetical protein